MDYSALTDAQQQQHNQQFQQQPYDPSQSQAYDAYYAAYHQQPQQPYDPAAAAIYHQQPCYPDGSAYAALPPAQPGPLAQDQYQQHPGHYAAPQDQQAPAGLNPAAAAAVAALSQLTQFAGNMDAAERAAAERAMAERQWGPQYHQYPLRPPVGGGAPYRGGRGRGGRGGPIRGGRGNFVHNSPMQHVLTPPFRGRGRGRVGRGGARHSHQSAPNTSAQVVVPSLPSQSAQIPTVRTVPKPPPQAKITVVAWCDICRADCNSLEILEQHKNGKRHKKTVKKLEEMQAQQRLMAGLPANALIPATLPSIISVASETTAAEVVPTKVVEANSSVTASVNMVEKTEPGVESQTVGQPEPTKVEISEAAVEQPAEGGYLWRPRMDGYDRFTGVKRKITKFGRGGKRLKTFEPMRKPIEAPRVCMVCNVTCDTQVVFESHLSGKKHMFAVKRFQVPGTVFGKLSVYVPPNQPTSSNRPEPLIFGFVEETFAHNDLPLEFSRPQEGEHVSGVVEGEGAAAPVLPSVQGSDHPEGEVQPTAGGEEDVSLGPEGQKAVEAFLSEVNMLEEATLTVANDVLPVPECVDNVAIPGFEPSVNVELESVGLERECVDNVAIPGFEPSVNVELESVGLDVEDPKEPRANIELGSVGFGVEVDPKEPSANIEPRTVGLDAEVRAKEPSVNVHFGSVDLDIEVVPKEPSGNADLGSVDLVVEVDPKEPSVDAELGSVGLDVEVDPKEPSVNVELESVGVMPIP